VPFKDGPAMSQADSRVVLDEGPGVVEVARGELSVRDR
jgi:hypothetical protein